ncbi:protein of unknown function [Candidatus Nitrosocosmicus franklandus]|uniref:Uncharacterized protein n=1 Tax=Candidatus Nitrosocosmicus franklandianus TaxID=1798806 RepID=A0A484II80_9ARCH|nr:protein of unknown function [Candidatus Nitrosocosmicus franklandus]
MLFRRNNNDVYQFYEATSNHVLTIFDTEQNNAEYNRKTTIRET